MADYCLIIPVYNGAPYIQATVRELGDFFSQKTVPQIIFVNDGSSDETEKMLLDMQSNIHVPIDIVSLQKNMGKGYAIKSGFAKAHPNTQYIVFTDIELPYGLKKIEEAVGLLKAKKYDMVVGDRTKNEQAQYSLYRKFFQRCFRLFLPRDLRDVPDTQSGLKAFTFRAAKTIFSLTKTHRWVADIEMFLIAIRHGYHIGQLPVTIKPACAIGRGGVRVMKHTRQILIDLFRVHSYDRRGAYYS